MYSYIGLNAGGEEEQGRLEAGSEKEVALLLRERSIFLLKVREGDQLRPDGNFASGILKALDLLRPGRFLPVTAMDRVAFFRQIALMLRAGYTLVSALEAGSEMQQKHGLRRAVNRMSDRIRRGASFSAGMADEKKIFSPMIANLVSSGEQSGNLDSILERLADNIERSKDLKRQLLAAMFYPSIVLLSSFFVVFVLVTYVVPRFAAFLAARNAVLPRSTQLLMDFSDWAVYWGGPAAVVAGIGVFFILAACTTRPGKRVVDRVILSVPIIGKAVLFASMAQSGWSLSMLLKSGFTALESLRITSGVLGNLAVGDCFKKASDGLLKGQPLSRTFRQPHIPPMMRRMAAVGEKSGQLDTVMQDVGEYYQKELVAKVKFITIMIEPVMILLAGGIVLFVYLSLFQAVMAISKRGM